MPLPFLVLVDTDDVQQDRLLAVCRVTSVICRPAHNLPLLSARHLLIDDVSADPDQIIADLDNGIDKAIVPLSLAKKLVGVVPATRLILLLDVANASAVPDSLRTAISGVLLKTISTDVELIRSISTFFAGLSIHVLSKDKPTPSTIRRLTLIGASLVIPFSELDTSITIADAFLAPVISDRSDGLFPTIISSYTQGGRTLGLVYSSRESVAQSILTGKGVYQSRKHGLWEKGKTSGATQEVVRIRTDCDADALEFSVIQHGSGFCHLPQPSCFGSIDGLAALESTLKARLASAPEGSYTRRLFSDQELLRAKIKEEADELCRAETKEEIAFEAADLFYFTLTRCVAAGIGIRDIEEVLNKKAAKVTRRPGNAKPQFMSNDKNSQDAPKNPSKPQVAVDLNAPIAMRTVDLSLTGPDERVQLLKRPVLRSDEMIAKVKPIVDDVRKRGDTALLELTAKFDKAQLEAPILLPPFYPFTSTAVKIDPAVRDAIDVAYANVRKFHAAQVQDSHLVVETMPGVTCSRFARPIARVGLYVPGGTAVLPSTALMLGVPAQVAGCEQVVLATPPRADGSVSPEVLYVAHLVGAHAILRAGGAQAVAALAYGTETCPKVDKIFGPGNQWVTAAKMFVQNDTEALVSIDMPAGPSEVLVSAVRLCLPNVAHVRVRAPRSLFLYE
jgi:phosphoribosyl-ATP pyrophosphohydrolase/phosphoribosyl-AMP cyclohydrolase/histidinol dehydrogenase